MKNGLTLNNSMIPEFNKIIFGLIMNVEIFLNAQDTKAV